MSILGIPMEGKERKEGSRPGQGRKLSCRASHARTQPTWRTVLRPLHPPPGPLKPGKGLNLGQGWDLQSRQCSTGLTAEGCLLEPLQATGGICPLILKGGSGQPILASPTYGSQLG